MSAKNEVTKSSSAFFHLEMCQETRTSWEKRQPFQSTESINRKEEDCDEEEENFS